MIIAYARTSRQAPTLRSDRGRRLADGAVLEVTGSRPDPNGVIVSSRVERGAARPINVDWRPRATDDGGYKISDVVIGGLSLAANGRTELQGVVERNGGRPQSIIAVMQQQIAGAQARDLAVGCRQAQAQPVSAVGK